MRAVACIFAVVLLSGCSSSAALSPEKLADNSAPVNCFTAAGNVCGSLMSSAVSCTKIPLAPGSFNEYMNCSGTVSMNITSKINSGLIQVKMLLGNDNIKNTVTIIPGTAPGVMNVQLIMAKVGAFFCTGEPQIEVYDGPSTFTGGRQLIVNRAPTTWRCN